MSMFPVWRIQLGAARRAMADGRWEEAAALLASDRLREFLPAKKLSAKLAGQFVARAATRFGAGGESNAGWRDLRQAAQLAPVDQQVDSLRRQESQRRMSAVYSLLAGGATTEAIAQLERMERRNLGGQERRECQALARRLAEADVAAREGLFPVAVDAIRKAQSMTPAAAPESVRSAISARLAQFQVCQVECDAAAAPLHAAVTNHEWSTVLTLAARILELAPRHAAARRAQRQAWRAAGMDETHAFAAGDSPLRDVRRPASSRIEVRSSTRPGAKGALVDTAVAQGNRGPRFVAWIDGVGGYLVCLGQEVVIGQPSSNHEVDIPVLADLSRRHAVIRRDAEAYVLTPIHSVAVNGQELAGPAVLKNNDRIRLGAGLEFLFRRPHALSATAVLERMTSHKLSPAVDGIVLMSDSCVLGPSSHCHVPCRPWEHDLVLYRRGGELAFRAAGPFEIDGRTFLAEAPLAWGQRIEGDDFALSFEELA